MIDLATASMTLVPEQSIPRHARYARHAGYARTHLSFNMLRKHKAHLLFFSIYLSDFWYNTRRTNTNVLDSKKNKHSSQPT